MCRRSIVTALATSVITMMAATSLHGQASRQAHPSAEMQRLSSMVGDWDVVFESRSGPDAPVVILRTRSTIAAILGGAFLQEQVTMPQPGGRSITLLGLLGFDRFRAVYRFAWLDDTYALMDVQEGHWEGDRLSVANTATRTTIHVGQQEIFGRMIWRDLSPDRFVAESHASLDGGATWFVQATAIYTRRTGAARD